MASVIEFVEGKRKLKVNREKSAVDRPWKPKFVGFKTICRFKEKVRELTDRTKSIAMEQLIGRLNRFLMGWIGYFRIATAKNTL